MAKNYIEMGQTIDFIATADVASGEVIALESLVIVSHGDVKTGEPGVGHAQGVFELPKAAGIECKQGEGVYLLNGEIGTDDTGIYAGKAWSAAESGANVVWVALNVGAPVLTPTEPEA